MIRLQNLTKTYKGGGAAVEALRGVNLDIGTGEYIAVMGKSGSGKSTLLHIIGLMDECSGGHYFYNDMAVDALSRKEKDAFRKKHISFVFQNYALMKYYTVFENVEIPLIAKGIKKKDRKPMVEAVMEQVGIAELRNKLSVNISGGQMQRCAIARALASDNDILLADEPTGALDVKTGEEIMEVFDRIRTPDRTIIIVTHNTEVAGRTDRIVEIEDGVVKEN